MKGMTPPQLHEVSGVIHCHSTYSDGMEPVPVIAEAANEAGLDFLVMTDHDTLAPLYEVREQYHGKTLILMGCEISPRHNHFLAYGISSPVSPHLSPAEFTAAVAEQGGVGFLAHPHDEGSRFLGQNSYSWDDWDVSHYTGMEIWNFFSDWVSGCKTLPAAMRALTDWRSVTRSPDPRTLARWDELGKSRQVVGIGGVDAHGIKTRILGKEIVLHPYKKAFQTVRTHLLLPIPFKGDVTVDRRVVLEALQYGSCYFANHAEGDPSGFTFTGRCQGDWVLMGQAVPHLGMGSVHFSTRVPMGLRGKPTLRLLKDGEVLAETVDCDLQAVDIGPGVYRAEAWVKGRGWIFSNPIYLRG